MKKLVKARQLILCDHKGRQTINAYGGSETTGPVLLMTHSKASIAFEIDLEGNPKITMQNTENKHVLVIVGKGNRCPTIALYKDSGFGIAIGECQDEQNDLGIQIFDKNSVIWRTPVKRRYQKKKRQKRS